MYFRFETEAHQIEKVVLEKIIFRDECMFVGVRQKRFVCSAIMNSERKSLKVRYSVDRQKFP